jgi:hypothetical protein
VFLGLSKNITTGVTSGAGTTYPFRARDSILLLMFNFLNIFDEKVKKY